MQLTVNCSAQDDIRRVKRDMEKIGSEEESLTSKINELNLRNDSSQREYRRIRGDKEKLMVSRVALLVVFPCNASGVVAWLKRDELWIGGWGGRVQLRSRGSVANAIDFKKMIYRY